VHAKLTLRINDCLDACLIDRPIFCVTYWLSADMLLVINLFMIDRLLCWQTALLYAGLTNLETIRLIYILIDEPTELLYKPLTVDGCTPYQDIT